MSNNSEYTIRQEQPADFSAVENLTREAFWNVYRPGCLEHYVLHCYRNHPDFIPELSLVLEGNVDAGVTGVEAGKMNFSEGAAEMASVGSDGAAGGATSGMVLRREILAHVMFAWSEILVDPAEGGEVAAGEEPRTAENQGGCSSQCSSQISSQEPRRLRMMTFGPISVRPDMQRKGLGKLLLDSALEKARDMGAGCVAMCGNIQFYGKCGFEVATSRGIRYAEDPDGDAPYFLIRELTPGFLDCVRGSYRDPAAYFVDEAKAEEFDKQFPPKEKKVLPGQLC